MADVERSVTCSAPVNIAVIKYWGKRDEELILPVNSSLSVTLDQEQMCATTTVAVSGRFERDHVWVNGREESMENPRLKKCLEEARRMSRDQNPGSPLPEFHVHICSENNFPTAAGLASSAAGYACLAFSLSKLYGIHGDISTLARLGSGSACRSVFGGFVKWERGEREDGTDSIAVQVAPSTHWPQLEVLVLVVCGGQKPISSTRGMRATVLTSTLMKYRCEVVVPQRMTEMETAILKKDFGAFSRLTMQDSNQFHAMCLDTFPPICYMNDVSKSIIRLVTAFNELYGEEKVAYTFDAGPNAVLYCLSKDMPQLVAMVTHYFPPNSENKSNYVRGISTNTPFEAVLPSLTFEPMPGALEYILHTRVGAGPREVTTPLLTSEGIPLRRTAS